MKVSAFSVNPFGEMTYVLWDENSHEAAIVDPGMSNREEQEALDRFIEKNGLKVKYLINTHLHIDHIFGNRYVEQTYGVRTSASPDDAELGLSAPQQAERFHLPIKTEPLTIGHELHDGDVLRIGDEELRVITTPGHSPGSLSLYCPTSGFLISGDTLFRRSVGRTDLPGGDPAALSDSIRNKLYKLPDETLVIPGHGPTTTIGEEKRGNPYV